MYDIEILESSEMLEKYKDLAQTYTKKYNHIEKPLKGLLEQGEIEGKINFGGITYRFSEKSKGLIGTAINHMSEGHYNRVTMQKAVDGSSVIFNIHFGKSKYNDILRQPTNISLAHVRFSYNEKDDEINNLKVTDCRVSKSTTPKEVVNHQFTKK